MQFLIQHWHCLFPLAGIIVAVFLFRDTSGKQRTGGRDDSTAARNKKQEEN